jgi:hypothetical protein
MPQELAGKDGKIGIGASDFAGLRNVSFSMSANNKSYGSSSSGGHTRTVAGIKSGTLSFDIVLSTDQDIFDEIKIGDQVTIHMEETGVTSSRSWTIPVRIDSMEEEIAVEESEPISVSCEAQTHGAWTYPDGTTSS